MKKIKLILAGLFALLTIILLSPQTIQASAEEINSLVTIGSNTQYANQTFNLNSNTCFFITDNSIATFDSCTFLSNECETIFHIEKGSQLILNNCVFNDCNYETAITNYGQIFLTNTTFNSSGTTINNLSIVPNSINIYSGRIPNITINAGYISVFENTIINGTIKLYIPSYYESKLLVKGIGDNVFANKLINKFSLKTKIDEFYIDYVGDKCSESIYDVNNNIFETIEQGDLILTSCTLVLNNNTFFTGKYCTANNFLLHKLQNEDYTLYYSNSRGGLNNYYCNNDHDQASRVVENYMSVINVTANSHIKNNTTPYSTITTTFLAKSNHAFFIDKPLGYVVENVEILINGVSNTDVLSVEEYFANNYYMRPIIIYKSKDFFSEDITINFILKESKQKSYIDITKPDDVEVNIPNNLYTGEIATFELTCPENVKVTKISFNNEEVAFNKTQNGYTFDVEIKDANTLIITTQLLPIEVIVTPGNFEFTYGDTINLEETITVEKTEENILVRYTYSNTSAGTHLITGATCTNTNYIIKLASGEFYYKINPLIVNLNPSSFEFTYEDEIIMSEEIYISKTKEYVTVNYSPSSINAGTHSYSDIYCTNSNYTLNITNNNSTYKINKKEVDLSKIKTKTYTTEYTKQLSLTNDMFIDTENLPSYVKLEIMQNSFTPKIGEQEINISVKIINSNYKFADDSSGIITCTLILTPPSVDISNFYFPNNYSITYDGNEHKLTLLSYTQELPNVNILYTYYLIKNEFKTKVTSVIHAGKYYVEARFTHIDTQDEIDTVLSTTYYIMPKYIDVLTLIENYQNYKYVYDGEYKYVNFDETILPDNIHVKSIENNIGYKNAGKHNIRINIETSQNYTTIDHFDISLEISPKEITVKLKQNKITYTGNEIQLEAIAIGTVNKDRVNIILGYSPKVKIGKYNCNVEDIDNINYYTNTTTLSYEIVPRQTILDVNFNSILATYDGNKHIPALEGVVPEHISYQISNNDCINVGKYSLTCTFTSLDETYESPEPLTATVTITEREILAIFIEPEDMLANGENKYIQVYFSGTVKNELPRYTETYSGSTKVAGVYSYEITLLDNNYILANSNVYEFIVYANKFSYKNNSLNFVIEGKLDPSTKLTITKNENITKIINLLDNKNIESCSSYYLNISDFTTDNTHISFVLDNLTKDVRYFKVYTYSSGQLKEVNFLVHENRISFNLNCGETIVFVQNQNNVYHNQITINIIIILSILCVLCSVIFALVTRAKNKLKV